MKNYFFRTVIFTFFTLYSLQSNAQWEAVDLGTTDNFYDVHFINDTIGWIAGDNAVYKTINGGGNWTRYNSAVSDTRYYGVYFKDEQNGWAIGKKKTSSTAGRVHYTDDGGETWKVYFTSGSLPWWSVAFASNNTNGTIVGQEGQILYTSDGGSNWSNRVSPTGTAGIIRDVTFNNGLNGIAVGYSSPSIGFLMRTTNGGNSWQTIKDDFNGALHSISFADSMNGLAVGSGGLIVRTVDGGETWSFVPRVNDQTLNGVHFYDSSNAIAVGFGGTIITSSDGGRNWTLEESGTIYALRNTYKNNDESSLAVGSLGTILKKGGVGGILKFMDNDDDPDNLNQTPPFISPVVTTNSKAYFYYFVEENEDTPPKDSENQFSVNTNGHDITVGVKYLGDGIAQFWLDLTSFNELASLEITIPDKADENSSVINFENIPKSFSVSLTNNPKTQSIEVFAGGSLGADLIAGGVGAGPSVAAAKLSVKGEGGMGFKFEKDESANEKLTRNFLYKFGLSVKSPSISVPLPEMVPISVGASANVSYKGLSGQTLAFSNSNLNSNAVQKAKAAYI